MNKNKIKIAKPFDFYVDKTGPCWIWRGSLNAQGYGLRKFRGASRLAHRISWILHNGEIPDGLCVLHRCDNPPCVNPLHLFLGTKKQNTHDMIQKGRARYVNKGGEQHGMSKLKEDQVIEIRRRAEKENACPADLAREFDVKTSHIRSIIKRRFWKHLL